MSGHSKWATTKYRKGAQDKARAKIFAKCIRAIEVAAREGGGDLDANATLRTAFQKARARQRPARHDREGHQAGDAATSRACATRPSTTRATAPAAWPSWSRRSATTATAPAPRCATSSAATAATWPSPAPSRWQFERKGIVTVPLDQDEDKVMEIAMEGGAEDMSSNGAAWVVTSAPGRPRVRAPGPRRRRHHARVGRPLASSPPPSSPCPTRPRPRRSCASSRRSTTTTTSRPSTPTPTSPTRCSPPSRADVGRSSPAAQTGFAGIGDRGAQNVRLCLRFESLSAHRCCGHQGRQGGQKRPEAGQGREGDPTGSPTDRLGEVRTKELIRRSPGRRA